MTRRDLMIVGATTIAAHVAPAVALEQPVDLPEAQPGSFFPTVGFSVNGEARSLKVDTRTTLLDAAARASAPDRHQERLRPRPVRRLHGDGGRPPDQFLPDPRGDARRRRGHDHRGSWARPEHLHPMQAAFVKHDGYQCGYCTPGQICSAVAMLQEIKAGIPSHVTADLMPRRRRAEAEIRERMSGNICRCGAYSNIVEAITEVAGRAGMRPFTYERATTPARRPPPPRPRHRGAKFIAGGTNLLDLMKLEIETPTPPDRCQRSRPGPDRGRPRTAACASARWCATPISPRTRRVRRDYPLLSRALLAGASGQLRNKATTAGNLLQRTRCPYFYDTNQPATSASPAAAARRSAGSAASSPSIGGERRLHRHPPERHGGRHARAGRDGRDRRRRTAPSASSRSPTSTACPATRRTSRQRWRPANSSPRSTLPKPVGGKQIYHKVRDRASYAFALVSVGAIIQPDGTGRVALGGVAPKPWRVEAAEAELPHGAKAVRGQAARRREADARKRLQADPGRAHARRRARGGEGRAMKFDTPATTNPIDQLKVVGQPTDRIDGPLKTTGTAPYAYEHHDVAPNPAYGYVVGAAIAKGRIVVASTPPRRGRPPGVIAVVTR